MVKRRCSLRQRMQDVDCVPHVQAFPEPAGAPRPRSETKALRIVTCPERRDGITRHRGRWRHFREGATVRPPEPEIAVGPARNLKTLLVHRAMVPSTKHGEVGQRRRAPVRPVAEVMSLAEADPAARKPAAAVPSVERPA